MDIVILSEDSLKIKGKKSSLVVNPTSSIAKTETDSIVYLENNSLFSDAKINGARISIIGAGDYEVGGIKFLTHRVDDKLVAQIDVDSVRVLIGSGKSIDKIHEKVNNTDLIVVNADKEFNYSILAAIEPRVILVYGPLKNEVSRALGKTDVVKTNKYSVTIDKLPSEMQYIILG